MSRKNYSSAFKTKVVLEVLREELGINEIAAKYSLNPNLVRGWRKTFLEKAPSVFEDSNKLEKDMARKEVALERKNTQMLKTIGQLTVERNFLQECFQVCGLPIPELDSETK